MRSQEKQILGISIGQKLQKKFKQNQRMIAEINGIIKY